MNEKYERAAYRILKRIGANQGYDGFKYSIDIITRIMEEPNRSFVLTGSKGLYAETAKRFKRSGWRQVERAVRHMIERIFESEDKEYQDVLGTERMTNKQFVESICNYI
ncbi:MAG: sporulation initiation factor Spo0A C-terminal domain-containing protein [Oscillospiraceae bacterium]